jgi:hypothetical protein
MASFSIVSALAMLMMSTDGASGLGGGGGVCAWAAGDAFEGAAAFFRIRLGLSPAVAAEEGVFRTGAAPVFGSGISVELFVSAKKVLPNPMLALLLEG